MATATGGAHEFHDEVKTNVNREPLSHTDERWARSIAYAVTNKRLDGALTESTDDLLRWLLQTPCNRTDALNRTMGRSMDLDAARRRTVKLLGDVLFVQARSPWESLALSRSADVDDIKLRYRRLVQVFHPDRGLGEERWLSACTRKLRDASETAINRKTHEPVMEAPLEQPPITRSAVHAGPSRRQQLLATLGSATSLRRRIVTGSCVVAGVYILLVVLSHTM